MFMVAKKYILFLSLVLLFGFLNFAQQTEVPDLILDSLVFELHNSVNNQRSIELEEIHGVYKLSWLHFVPSLNYDFINNKYYVTINSAPLISNLIGKRQENRKISATNRKYDYKIKSSEIHLRSLLISINQSIEALVLSYVIVCNDIEIFQIKFSEFNYNEIDTESFLKEKSIILNKIKNHNADVAAIQRQLLEIELLTDSLIDIDLSGFFISHSKILGIYE